jgi:murein DD-endopeptidase MepM/ murein hydrolase activator NlpD
MVTTAIAGDTLSLGRGRRSGRARLVAGACGGTALASRRRPDPSRRDRPAAVRHRLGRAGSCRLRERAKSPRRLRGACRVYARWPDRFARRRHPARLSPSRAAVHRSARKPPRGRRRRGWGMGVRRARATSRPRRRGGAGGGRAPPLHATAAPRTRSPDRRPRTAPRPPARRTSRGPPPRSPPRPPPSPPPRARAPRDRPPPRPVGRPRPNRPSARRPGAARMRAPSRAGAYAGRCCPPPAVRQRRSWRPRPVRPGHRGVDLAGAVGQPVLAARGGTVAFRGPGRRARLRVRQHDDGLRTTYEPLVPSVRAGAVVAQAPCSAPSCAGHRAAPPPACTGACGATAGVPRPARPAPARRGCAPARCPSRGRTREVGLRRRAPARRADRAGAPTRRACSWHTRDSVTPSSRPISASVRFSR